MFRKHAEGVREGKKKGVFFSLEAKNVFNPQLMRSLPEKKLPFCEPIFLNSKASDGCYIGRGQA